MIYAAIAALAVTFYAGAKYGSGLEKRSVAVALGVLVKAKVRLASAVASARTAAQADAQRLEELAAKYL